MRTIKFRGKSLKTGNWFYGNLFDKDTQGRTHITTTRKGCLCIDPDTVGQFTGFCDFQGKEIYEGDIIELIFETRTCVDVVMFSEGRFVSVDPQRPYKADGLYLWVKYARVIGNIYDNPEILVTNTK